MVVTKLEAARIQLDASIEHFFNDEHVCAITLAGAAEDILDGLIEASGKQGSFKFLKQWYEERTNQKLKNHEFSREVANIARNWLKHSKDDPETELEITKLESLIMLMRAIGIYKRMGNADTEQTQKFHTWYKNSQEEISELSGYPIE